MTFARRLIGRAWRELRRVREAGRAVRDAVRGWVTGLRSGPYRFTATDVVTHVVERVRWLPRLERTDGDPYPLYQVAHRTFRWPDALPTAGLPWVFTEVFAPFRLNPSSYDHPQLRPSDREWVLDAGAGEGFYTLWALEHGAGRVVAVEPLEILQGTLRATFPEAIDDRRVEVVRAALGDEGGETTIGMAPDRPSEAVVGVGSEIVPLRTLDDLADELGLGPNGLVKMDIEGAEMDALRGATALLRSARPALAIAVYHGVDNARMCRDIVLAANPSYRTAYRGLYAYEDPPRPYMLFAW